MEVVSTVSRAKILFNYPWIPPLKEEEYTLKVTDNNVMVTAKMALKGFFYMVLETIRPIASSGDRKQRAGEECKLG